MWFGFYQHLMSPGFVGIRHHRYFTNDLWFWSTSAVWRVYDAQNSSEKSAWNSIFCEEQQVYTDSDFFLILAQCGCLESVSIHTGWVGKDGLLPTWKDVCFLTQLVLASAGPNPGPNEIPPFLWAQHPEMTAEEEGESKSKMTAFVVARLWMHRNVCESRVVVSCWISFPLPSSNGNWWPGPLHVRVLFSVSRRWKRGTSEQQNRCDKSNESEESCCGWSLSCPDRSNVKTQFCHQIEK